MEILGAVNASVQLLVLVAIVVYTRETIRLREIASEQLEGSWTPILMLARGADPLQTTAVGGRMVAIGGPYCALRNSGAGPALHVKFSIVVGPHRDDQKLTAIPAGGEHRLPVEGQWFDEYPWKFDAEYESLGGVKYRTRISSAGDDSWGPV